MNIPAKQRVYVGTYTQMKADEPARSEGIYIYELDSASGKLTFQSAVKNVSNPSYLSFTKDHRFAFAVNERNPMTGDVQGTLSAFAVDREAGVLSFLNMQTTRGSLPCYVQLDSSEQWVMVSNYGGGSAAVFPVGEDGRLGESVCLIQNEGHSVNPDRQSGPHMHSLQTDPAQKFIFVADLGLDRIMIYRLDAATGQLIPNDPPFVNAAPGSGPRLMVFHPNGRIMYAVNELDSTVVVYAYDSECGTLQPIQTVSTLPEGFTGAKAGAHLYLTQSGKFLYTSDRGNNGIAAFAVDPESGHLRPIQNVSSGGEKPRYFGVDLSERYLIAANQDSGNLVVFEMDQRTGMLKATGETIDVPSPVCVKFVEMS